METTVNTVFADWLVNFRHEGEVPHPNNDPSLTGR